MFQMLFSPVFFLVPYPVKTSEETSLHDFLSFVSLSNPRTFKISPCPCSAIHSHNHFQYITCYPHPSYPYFSRSCKSFLLHFLFYVFELFFRIFFRRYFLVPILFKNIFISSHVFKHMSFFHF